MMEYLETLFFYSISCSVVLVYGIGLEKSFFASSRSSRFISRIAGLFLEAILSTAALYFIVIEILLPYHYQYLVPMATIMVCSIIHLVIALIIPAIRETTTGTKILFFGTVFLAISEATGFYDSLVIVCASILSFSLVTVILFSIRERIAATPVHTDLRGAPLVLTSMGLLCIVFYSADLSWWLSEVFR